MTPDAYKLLIEKAQGRIYAGFQPEQLRGFAR